MTVDTTYPAAVQGDANRALRQFARAAQATMIDASEPVPSVTHAAERFRALECLMARRSGDFHLISSTCVRGCSIRRLGRMHISRQTNTCGLEISRCFLPINGWALVYDANRSQARLGAGMDHGGVVRGSCS